METEDFLNGFMRDEPLVRRPSTYVLDVCRLYGHGRGLPQRRLRCYLVHWPGFHPRGPQLKMEHFVFEHLSLVLIPYLQLEGLIVGTSSDYSVHYYGLLKQAQEWCRTHVQNSNRQHESWPQGYPYLPDYIPERPQTEEENLLDELEI